MYNRAFAAAAIYKLQTRYLARWIGEAATEQHGPSYVTLLRTLFTLTNSVTLNYQLLR